MSMAWVYLFLAGLSEMIWPFAMKLSQNYFKWGPTAVTLILSFPVSLLMAGALKTIPAGTVYAMVIGIGAVGACLIGILFFQESTNWVRLVSLGFIVVGLVGLKFFSGAAE